MKPKSEFANRFATTVQSPHPLIYSLVIGVNLHFFLIVICIYQPEHIARPYSVIEFISHDPRLTLFL
jgi:hypothetical protein